MKIPNIRLYVFALALLGLGLLGPGLAACAQGGGDVVAGDLGRKLDGLVVGFVEEGFSGAVLVAKDGKVS